ncbi:MAG TPA: phosphotransferase [Streptosporangiaceae bacterium]|nr:phosphotransferase [Streptosporangiaceae bacterium]
MSDEWLRRYFGAEARLDFRPLRGNDWLTDGIWRVTDGSRSVIAKTVSARSRRHDDTWSAHWTQGGNDLAHWNYWKREYLVYHSDIPSQFARSGVHAPALLGATESTDSVTMFLEDCDLTPATSWRASGYCAAARDLGLAQGELSSRGKVASQPWFCSNYMRDYALEKPFDRHVVASDEIWLDLVETGVVTPQARDRQVRFAQNELQLLALLNMAPFTLCHNDYWTRNLFGGSAGTTTVIDWAFVGFGPMGADVANLVASAGFDGFVAAAELDAFSEQVFEAYLAGLRGAGWKGDERAVRLGYLASAAKYAWVVAAMLTSSATPGHPIYVGYGNGRHLNFHAVATTLNLLATWSDVALALAETV